MLRVTASVGGVKCMLNASGSRRIVNVWLITEADRQSSYQDSSGDSSFAVAGPLVWNMLPASLHLVATMGAALAVDNAASKQITAQNGCQ